MALNRDSLRQRLQSSLGRALPPVVAVPLRSRFGGSREPELAILPTFIRAGDTVIDVGAHRGVYVYRMARLAGSSGHVVAYEPQPEMVAYLMRASRAGVMRRVDLRASGLSDSEGEAILSIPVHGGVRIVGQATLRDVEKDADAVEHRVSVAMLDNEPLPGRVTFIKIDVEGHELSLLKGGVGLLSKDRPTLLIEVELSQAGHRVSDLAELVIDELGYTAYELAGPRLIPVDRKRWNGEGLNNRPGGGYVNNFVFRP